MEKEIYFEWTIVGNSLKMTAIDPETQTEAVVIVPSSLPIEAAKQQALNKLRYLLKK